MGTVAEKKIGKPCPQCGGTVRYVKTGACVPCVRRRTKEWSLKNPERARRSWNRIDNARRYGLAEGEREAMLALQGGRCAVCGTDTPGKKGWCLDHDHRFAPDDRRGHRGLVCTRCNTGLGMFCDNQTSLRRAAEYLAAHEARLAA